MNFLNQALLPGLIAVSIPVIIHLLNRRRFRKVPWAAMRFLKVSVEQNQRRMKLEDLILLLLRCALVAVLVFALARPVVDGLQGLPGSKVAVAVVIDNSASMGAREGDRSRLALARRAAVEVLEGLPAGSPVAVMTPFRPDEPTSERSLARQRIENVGQTDRHADLLSALEEAARAVDGQSAAEEEIYLITDGHAEEWSAFASLHEKVRELSAGRKLHLVLVGSPADANLGISRLAPSGSLPAVGRPFRLEADIANHGKAPVSEVPVQLLVNGQPLEESRVIDEIQPGRSESVTFYATLPSAGYHRVTVALGGDSFPFDDRRTVVVRAVEEVRVLLVDGEPGAEARESETFFLRHALAPVAEEGRASYPVKPRIVTGSELGSEKLADYDAVVLANVADLALPLAERLTDYVEGGGGLLVFPGDNVRIEFYNTMLHSRHGLLPAALVPHRPGEGPDARSLEPTETNPLGLESELLATARFRRAFGLAPGPGAGVGRVALRYDDGAPALVESEFGLGKLFLFTSTADMAWNDLAVNPGFVPLVNRLLGGIVQHHQAGLNIQAGEVLRHPVGPALAGKAATVSEVDDPESLGRLTVIEEGDGKAVLRFGETHRAGAYLATIDGVPDPVLFSVEPSGRESSPGLLGSRQIDLLADSASVLQWKEGSGGRVLATSRRGSELWLPLLFVVIALAAVELGLAQWFSRSK